MLVESLIREIFENDNPRKLNASKIWRLRYLLLYTNINTDERDSIILSERSSSSEINWYVLVCVCLSLSIRIYNYCISGFLVQQGVPNI